MWRGVLLRKVVFKEVGFKTLTGAASLIKNPSVLFKTFAEDRMRWGGKSFAGRNRAGQIVCRGRGGRVWATSAYVDRMRRLGGHVRGRVLKVVREPVQSGYLALSLYERLGVFSYV